MVEAWLQGRSRQLHIKDKPVLNNELRNIEREGPVAPSVVIDGNVRAADRRQITKRPRIVANKLNDHRTN